jgi:hypothetical protein
VKLTREYFGMMWQGSSVDEEGEVRGTYLPIPVGVNRLWDTRAAMTFLSPAPNTIDLTGLRSQVALAEKIGAKVLYTFGFTADPNFPRPEFALLPGSRNRPTLAYLAAVANAVLDYSLEGGSRRIHIYELGNEHALKDEYWDGSVEQSYYQAAWLNAGIKARDPGGLTLCPSLNDLTEPSGLAYAEEYCALMRERGAACDAIAFHMYAATIEQVHAQLANLDRATAGLPLDLYCTEFNGTWEAADILAARGVKLWTLNGQQPPAPYSDGAKHADWLALVNRLTTIGPKTPSATQPSSRGGCLARLGL